MPSKTGKIFSSIRFKVVLWYMLFLAVTLGSFSALLYGGFCKKLYDDFDDLLSSRAEGVSNSITTYWQAAHEFKASDEDDFITVASDWVQEKRRDPELMKIFVQILRVDGKSLVSSKSMPYIAPISKEDLKDIADGEDSFDTLSGKTAEGKKLKFRVYSKPVIEDGKVSYIVQVTGPVDLVSLALSNLRLILFVLLPLTILLAGIPGVLLVRMTLHPVDAMVDTLRQITAENLKLKIHIPDTKDEIRRLADTFNDMIERLDRSFSSQQRFIQDISHELRAPINILKGELEAAMKSKCSEEEYKALFSRMLSEIEDFTKTIEELQALSQNDRDQPLLEIKKVDMAALAKSVLDDMKILAEQKDIKTQLSAPSRLILDGDERQLRRLLMNLIDNAIKYTYRKGEMMLKVEAHGSSAQISVSDTGIGMPEDELPYIFDRFYQIGRSRTQKGSFGLGLSSVKSIVEAHKGAITVKSQPGKGSDFIVSLPLSYPA